MPDEPAPPITIRPARPEEAERIGVLTEKVYRDDGHLDDDAWYAQTLLDGATRIRDALVLVAEVDAEVVAQVAVVEPGTPFSEISRSDELEVRMLAVAEPARRRGVADRLMDEIEDRARAQGRSGVVLSTEPTMVGAHALYERRGYVRQPDRDWDVDGFHLLAYRLDL